MLPGLRCKATCHVGRPAGKRAPSPIQGARAQQSAGPAPARHLWVLLPACALSPGALSRWPAPRLADLPPLSTPADTRKDTPLSCGCRSWWPRQDPGLGGLPLQAPRPRAAGMPQPRARRGGLGPHVTAPPSPGPLPPQAGPRWPFLGTRKEGTRGVTRGGGPAWTLPSLPRVLGGLRGAPATGSQRICSPPWASSAFSDPSSVTRCGSSGTRPWGAHSTEVPPQGSCRLGLEKGQELRTGGQQQGAERGGPQETARCHCPRQWTWPRLPVPQRPRSSGSSRPAAAALTQGAAKAGGGHSEAETTVSLERSHKEPAQGCREEAHRGRRGPVRLSRAIAGHSRRTAAPSWPSAALQAGPRLGPSAAGLHVPFWQTRKL